MLEHQSRITGRPLRSMDTITVNLEDGTQEQRPYTLRPQKSQEIVGPGAPPLKVPVTYPGETATQVFGGWLIQKTRPK